MHQHISSLQIIPEEMYDTGHLLDHAFLAEKEFTKLIAETFVQKSRALKHTHVCDKVKTSVKRRSAIYMIFWGAPGHFRGGLGNVNTAFPLLNASIIFRPFGA